MPGTRPVDIFVTSQDLRVPISPDPDIYLRKAGLVAVSQCAGVDPGAGCAQPRKSEELTGTLPQGDYVLEVFEYSHVDPDPNAVPRGRTCMFVTITG